MRETVVAAVGCLSLAALGWISCSTRAAEPAISQGGVKQLLERTVLAAGQPLAEVQRYCERRIAVLPHFATWSAWQHEADRLRQRVLEDIVFRGVPANWRDSSRRIEWLDSIPGGPGYRLKKLRYEALPGLWIPALLYEPDRLKGRVPVVLNVNGHDSNGKQAPYKQLRCINLAKRGMIALNLEWLGMGQLNGEGFAHTRMNQLDLCGRSGLAVFYLVMERGLDILVDHPHADTERVAMAGLSGGGWQTILLSSLDRRVTLSNPVAGYSAFKTRVEFFADLGDSEQTPADLAALADYTHLTALRAPRPTLLTYNSKDECCFVASHALQPLLDAALPVYELAGFGSRLRSHINDNPGTHNFLVENREAFYKIVGDYFYPGDASFSASEIDSEQEVKSADELNVPLPSENLDLHKLAVSLLGALPAHAASEAVAHPPAQRIAKPTKDSVCQVARMVDYQPAAEMVAESVTLDTHARYWQLKLATDWTVPVVELWRGTPQGTSCVAADGGRTAAIGEVEALLAVGQRVLAVDPFYLGESKLADRGYLFALFVSSVGARPLGVQADELQAVHRWAAAQFDKPIERQIAIGPRIGLAALVAAATAADDERPRELVLHGALKSLRQVIMNNWKVDAYPELFCFGLLQTCDIEDLVGLAAPCQVICNP